MIISNTARVHAARMAETKFSRCLLEIEHGNQ